MLPEHCHHHRQRSRTHHNLDSFAKSQTNSSTCSSVVGFHTTSSSQVQSSQSVCSKHLEIYFLFTKCPRTHRFLVCFSRVGRSIHPDTVSSQESQDGIFLHGFDKIRYSSPNHSRRYLLSNLWIKCHAFPPLATKRRTACAVASHCSGFLKSSLYQRHCAAKSSDESGSSSQTANYYFFMDFKTEARGSR